MNEKMIQNAILRRFGTLPFMRLWRQNTGVATYDDLQAGTSRKVRFGVLGGADLSGILPDGRRLEIEVKGLSGRQRPEQRAFQEMIERFGGVYILARGVLDVEHRLKELGYPV